MTDLYADLYLGGRWVDITADVVPQAVQITQGRGDESSSPTPGGVAIVVDNVSGDYTPENPYGRHYPYLQLGTPLRISTSLPSEDTFTRTVTGGWGDLETGEPWVTSGGAASDRSVNGTQGVVTLPGSGVSVDRETPRFQYLDQDYGDVEVLAAITVDQLASGDIFVPGLLLRRADPDTYYAALLSLGTDASVKLVIQARTWIPDWVEEETGLTYTAGQRLWLRARVEGRRQGTGYPTIRARTWLDGTEEPAVWQATYTDISSPLESGPCGTIAWAFGENNNLNPQIRFDDVQLIPLSERRFYGELADISPTWPYGDLSGDDVDGDDLDDPDVERGVAYATLTAAGVLRRLTQGSTPLRSAYYRYVTGSGRAYSSAGGIIVAGPARVPPIAYWPCEDGSDATRIASAVGGRSGLITGTPELASNSDHVASAPLPVMKDARFTFEVDPYTTTGRTIVSQLVSIPSAGAADNQQLLSARTTGTANLWAVYYRTGSGGALQMKAFDEDGSTLLDTSGIAFAVDGFPFRLSIDLTQVGSAIDWVMAVSKLLPDGSLDSSIWNGTLSSRTVGRVVRISSAYHRGLTDTAIGHVTLTVGDDFLYGVDDALRAHRGEVAGKRIERLCSEEGVPFVSEGNLFTTEPVGPQKVAAFGELVNEATAADGGILHETRSEGGLTYRTRQSLYNQPAALLLDAASVDENGTPVGDIVNPFAPVLDDQAARNDITVDRPDGSSVRSVDEEDIAKRGRYDEQVTLNVAADSQLTDQAGWRRHLGTWGGMRYPAVSPALNNRPSLVTPFREMRLGDLIQVVNLPPQHPTDTVEVLAQGYTETITPAGLAAEVNASPGGPWRVFVVGDQDYGRLDTSGAALATYADELLTTMLISTDSGRKLWITTATRPGDFPFYVQFGGEVAKVTAISGTISPQTFTVERGVNGVRKVHPAGTRVRIYRGSAVAL